MQNQHGVPQLYGAALRWFNNNNNNNALLFKAPFKTRLSKRAHSQIWGNCSRPWE